MSLRTIPHTVTAWWVTRWRRIPVWAALATMLLIWASPAAAVADGPECINPPVPASPTSGASGMIMQWLPSTPDPAGTDGFTTGSMWGTYGPGGFQVFMVGRGCPTTESNALTTALAGISALVPGGSSVAGAAAHTLGGFSEVVQIFTDPLNALSDFVSSCMSVVTSLDVFIERLLVDDFLGNIVIAVASYLAGILAKVWFVVAPISFAAMLAVNAHRRDTYDDVKDTFTTTARSYGIYLLGGILATCGGYLLITYLQATRSALSIALGGTVNTLPTSDVLGTALDRLHYNAWSIMELGNNPDAINTFGPAIFKACNITRYEAAHAPLQNLITQHQAACKTVFSQLYTQHPDAFYQASGMDTRQRAGIALVLGGLLFSSVALTWLYVLVRDVATIAVGSWKIIVGIVASVAAIHPKYHEPFTDAVKGVLSSAVRAIAYTGAAAIMLAIITGVCLNPLVGMPPWAQLLTAAALSVALMVGLWKVGLVRDLRKVRAKASAARTTASAVNTRTNEVTDRLVDGAIGRYAAASRTAAAVRSGEHPVVRGTARVYADVRDASEPTRERIRTRAAHLATAAAIGVATSGMGTAAQAGVVAARQIAEGAARRRATTEAPTPTTVPSTTRATIPADQAAVVDDPRLDPIDRDRFKHLPDQTSPDEETADV